MMYGSFRIKSKTSNQVNVRLFSDEQIGFYFEVNL